MTENLFTRISGFNRLSMRATIDHELDAIVLQVRDEHGNKIEFVMAPESAIDLGGELMLAVLELGKNKRATRQ